MAKKRRQAVNSRDAPTQKRNGTWLCSTDGFNMLVQNGYTRLSDCPEVRMCVHKYADLISSMTIHLMQNTEKGDIRLKNALSRKMDIEPYSLMTRKAWMYNIVWSLMLEGDGNQITLPIYTADGLLEDLKPMPASRVSFMPDGDSYKVLYSGKTFAPDEVLHFTINPDPEQPWRGTGYRAVLSDVVKGLKQAGKTRQSLMGSPSPSLIVSMNGLTDELNTAEGREKISEKYLNETENGKPWFIPADLVKVDTVKPLTLKDLAIADGIALDKRTVAGIFDMPTFVVGVGEFNKEAHNNFISTGLMGVAQVIQQELTRKTLYAHDLYWKFNQRSLMAYSMDEIMKASGEMMDRAAMFRNEARDWIGLPPDDAMEELLALENYIPARLAGQQQKLVGTGTDAKQGGGEE